MVMWAVLRSTKVYKLFPVKNIRLLQIHRESSNAKHIDKILIANRGEIACRIIRTARKLGIKTVAVYSDADEKAMHVVMADEAYHIGPAPAQQSYLSATKIIDIVKKSGSQAIHPGYGFLSENADFCEECQKQGIIFIGPPASAIRDMGIKSTSKEIMSNAGVPVIEGYHGKDQSIDKLKAEALRIGFPVMIKAVRGGGGKGMRIAHSKEDFEEALRSAQTESQKAFGNSDVLLEKFVTEPRHVEVQIFADSYGNAVHLFERDCSVQRRHQKIIEEAPAPELSDKVRQELGLAAVRAAKAVGYIGAGTVEFILDRKTHNFHFMEMNTRLQVEHPVTEMITGFDLVDWQIKIAAGEKLPVQQEDITFKGHAFEARIYAEDPRGGFLPGAGQLLHLSTPLPSDDVRIETGVREGDEVTVHYDPMIAKLVVWGKDRLEALTKLRANLCNYNICGLETNINFLLNLCTHPEFAAGNIHTNFIKDHNDTLFPTQEPTVINLIEAALAIVMSDEYEEKQEAIRNNDQYNPFIVESAFRVNYFHSRKIKLNYGGKDYTLSVTYLGGNKYEVFTEERQTPFRVEGSLFKKDNISEIHFNIDGFVGSLRYYRNEEALSLFDQMGKLTFHLDQPQFWEDEDVPKQNENRAVSPMPGVIERILVKEGDFVKQGDSLLVLIAMKMEYVVKAPKDTKILRIRTKAGDNVPKDEVLMEFEDEGHSLKMEAN